MSEEEIKNKVTELQNNFNSSASSKGVIVRLEGTEVNPIVLNSLDTNFYIVPKDNYYKFYNTDTVKICNYRTLLILSKQSDQVEVFMIDSKNVKEYIILNDELQTSIHMKSSKMFDYLKELVELELDTLNKDNKKLVTAINELFLK